MPRNINSYKTTSKQSSYSNNKSINTPTTPTLSTHPTPPTTVNHTYQSPSIGTSIKDGIVSGFGWGIGTSVARSIFGGSSSTQQPSQVNPVQTTQQIEKCSNEKNEYFTCLKYNSAGSCYNHEELLKACLEK